MKKNNQTDPKLICLIIYIFLQQYSGCDAVITIVKPSVKHEQVSLQNAIETDPSSSSSVLLHGGSPAQLLQFRQFKGAENNQFLI